MIVIGIDPGLTGAIAMIGHRGEFLAIADMPVMMRGAGTGAVKNQVDSIALSELLHCWLDPFDKNEIVVMIEAQSPMGGGQHASMIFSLAFTAGIIEGVVAAQRYPHKLVAPGIWKKAMGLSAKTKDAKDMARTMAQRMYPSADLHLKKHHNRAESILIARYGQNEYH